MALEEALVALVVAAAICCGAAVGPIAAVAVADATAPSVAAAAAATAAPAADLAAVAPALATEGCAAIGTDALRANEYFLPVPEIVHQSRLVLLELRSHCKVWQLQSCQCQQTPQYSPSQGLV